MKILKAAGFYSYWMLSVLVIPVAVGMGTYTIFDKFMVFYENTDMVSGTFIFFTSCAFFSITIYELLRAMFAAIDLRCKKQYIEKMKNTNI